METIQQKFIKYLNGLPDEVEGIYGAMTTSGMGMGISQSDLRDIVQELRIRNIRVTENANGSFITGDFIRQKDRILKILTPDVAPLETLGVQFNDQRSVLTIGEKEISLPRHQNEYALCSFMFQKGVKEPVSWDEIYESMFGKDSENTKKDQKMLKDTVDRLNNRIKRGINTDDPLMEWENKHILRLC